MTDKAFVIMQIGEKGSQERIRADEIADYVIGPVLKEFNLGVHRADRDPTPGQITPQILKSLIGAPIVIADLTGRNPNVYYELAIAHSFAKPTVILCDKPSSLAFDTKDERVIPLGDSPRLGVVEAEEAKKLLREALEVILAPSYKPSSIVSETAASRSLDQLAPEDPQVSELTAIREGVEEIRANLRPRVVIPPNVVSETRNMRALIDSLVEQGYVSTREVRELIDEETSDSFDSWVHRLMEASRSREDRGMSDEPPF